jgi:hypothetical protein
LFFHLLPTSSLLFRCGLRYRKKQTTLTTTLTTTTTRGQSSSGTVPVSVLLNPSPTKTAYHNPMVWVTKITTAFQRDDHHAAA